MQGRLGRIFKRGIAPTVLGVGRQISSPVPGICGECQALVPALVLYWSAAIMSL